jgi:PiT family inorganic phosphate transporter
MDSIHRQFSDTSNNQVTAVEIIAQHATIFLIMAVVFGVYMAWGIGANDVANAMGTSVGSGAVTVKQAIIIAAIFEFAGAVIAGGQVTNTIRGGIIDIEQFTGHPELLVYGMLAALLAAGTWLMIASSRGWPVSTTHTIVGAIVGFGMVGIGLNAIHWEMIGTIVASWFVSPLVGGAIALVLMLSIQYLILNKDDPVKAARFWGPFYVFLVGWIVSLVTLFKGLSHLKLDFTDLEVFIISTIIGVITGVIGWLMIRKVQTTDKTDRRSSHASVEKIFVPMMIFTAAAMAFGHGANDVANAIGPLAAINSVIETGGEVAKKAPLPMWILVVGAIGIVIGLATMGYKVMQTIGTKITELTPSRGYCATLAAATTVVVASKLGLPISTTQVAVGAVMGVGIARGIGALDLRVIGGIMLSWLITLPVGMGLAALFFFLFKGIFS